MISFRLHFTILFAILIGPISFVSAQSFFDVVKIDYGKSYFDPKQTAGFEFDHVNLQINAGTKVKDDNRILYGFTGELQTFDVDYFLNPSDHIKLKSSAVILGYLHFSKDKKWRTIGQVRLRNQADEIKINSDHFQYGGWLLFTLKQKENLSYFFGGYYNSEFYGSSVYPILGIDWQPSDRTSLYVLAPSRLRFEYAAIPSKAYVALEMEQQKTSYDIRSTTRLDYFLKHEINAQFVVEYIYVDQIAIFSSIGHLFKSKYELFGLDGSQQGRPQLDDDLNNNWNFKVGIAHRLRFKNK